MISQEDLQKYKSLKGVIIQGDYKVKGDAILAMASLFEWYESLGEKLNSIYQKQESEKMLSGAKITKKKKA